MMKLKNFNEKSNETLLMDKSPEESMKMSDEEDGSINRTSTTNPDHRRRLAEIKFELQRLNREKKKYDVEKLTQDAEFLQSEINDLSAAINDVNQEINRQTVTKKNLHIKITNLRSKHQLRYANSAIALRDKRQYEQELKKENKTEAYRELARRQIRNIEAALPILQEEDEYKQRMKVAEEAQQAAMNKRKKLEDNLNKNLGKQTEIRKSLTESSEKRPQIELNISNLRAERERLLSSIPGQKQRRLASLQTLSNENSPSIRSAISIEENALENEKAQSVEQLNKVKTLIHYFREKMLAHGLSSGSDHTKNDPSLTVEDQKTILSSFMNDTDSQEILLCKQPESLTTTAAIAMKFPRNLDSHSENEIIHSPYADQNEFQYKKELSADILNKYGGQVKKNKTIQHKHPKKQRKNCAVSHPPHMITLYNHVRSISGSSDTLPSMPMFECDLLPTIKCLESIEQSLEFYLGELSRREQSRSSHRIEEPQAETEDSALETFSNASSLVETTINRFDLVSSRFNDKKRPIRSSSPQNLDRQISDEGYRSVRNDPEKRLDRVRSKSDEHLNQLDQSFTKMINLSSSLPKLIQIFPEDSLTDFQSWDFAP